MIEPASIQETWLSLLRGKNFDGDACLEGLVRQTVDRLDAQEAKLAELKNTCGRLRTTMVDRKLYEAATNHIEVLEAKIQELQADRDAANTRIAELEHVIEVILPMAKGYASEHPVGGNWQKTEWAETLLRTKALGDS